MNVDIALQQHSRKLVLRVLRAWSDGRISRSEAMTVSSDALAEAGERHGEAGSAQLTLTTGHIAGRLWHSRRRDQPEQGLQDLLQPPAELLDVSVGPHLSHLLTVWTDHADGRCPLPQAIAETQSAYARVEQEYGVAGVYTLYIMTARLAGALTVLTAQRSGLTTEALLDAVTAQVYEPPT